MHFGVIINNHQIISLSSNETANVLWFLGQIPTLEGIPNNGLCDIRRQDCIRTRVQGNSFIDSEQLSCQMAESKVGIPSFFLFRFCYKISN